MSRDQQQQDEWGYLRQFLQARNLPEDCASRGADPPDFLLCLAGRKISVELTNVFQQSPEKGAPFTPQEHEGLTQRIVNEATGLSKARSLRPGQYNVHFAPRLTMNAREVSALAESLVNAADRCLAPSMTTPSGSTCLHAYELPDIPQVHGLSVMWTPLFEEPVWTTGTTAFLPWLAAEHVEPAITRKAKDLSRYASDVDATCLLLVLPAGGLAGAFNLGDPPLPASIVTPFSFTFLLDGFSGRTWQVGAITPFPAS